MQPRKTPRKNLYVHRGTAKRLLLRVRTTDGGLRSFTTALKFRVTLDAGGTIELAFDSGISLAEDEGVTQARATVVMSVAQSRTIPLGNFARYELQDLELGREEVIMMGRIIGIGGDNQDG